MPPKKKRAALNEDTAALDELWERHCGLLQQTLHYTDEFVGEMWDAFRPVLEASPATPIEESALPGRATTTTTAAAAAPTCVTHTFTIDLRPAAADPFCGGAGGGAALSEAMLQSIRDQPRVTLPLLEFFAAVMLFRRDAAALGSLGRVAARVAADPAQAVPFDYLGASQLERLVTVKGTIVRLSPARIACTRLAYRCGRCGAVKSAPTEDGVLVYPGPCAGRCRGYKWTPLTSDGAVCEEVQQLKLQEHTDVLAADADSSASGGGHHHHPTSTSSSSGAAGGGVSKVVEVELREPLLDSCVVGDSVCVCGVLGTRRGGGRAAGGTQQICLYARSVTGLAAQSAGVGAGGGRGDLVWSPEESGRYYEISRHPQWFDRLAATVAPALYGMTMVKEALLLAVLGGSSNGLGGRSSIHVLLLGDPGLGKSQLLRAACGVAPRSAFVSAHTSSSCGLTVTLSRDPVSGEATFEAGAVVHGDGGVTCIDEIDKGGAEHKALLEVMEQETVSIAKAGMVFAMPVHTAILAAGNPVGGRFDLSKPIAANVNLSPALLSRFDIVVCLRDPLRHETEELTRHVLQVHRHAPSSTSASSSAAVGGAGAGGGPLSLELAQRFILFARSQCHPTLAPEACGVLRAHYLDERAKVAAALGAGETAGRVERPVTPRYLQALIRVAQARAKAELRLEATRADAEYAIRLLQSCLLSFRPDGDTGAAAAMAAASGKKAGKKKNQRDVVVDLLKAEILRSGGDTLLSFSTIIAACEEAGCKNPNTMLHQMNEFGVLLQKGDRYMLRGV